MLFTSLLFGLQLAAVPAPSPAPLADTLFITETDSYSLLTVRRGDMPSGAPFDAAAKRYKELFGTPAPHVFMLIDSQGSDATQPPAARDTVRIARGTIPRHTSDLAGEDTTAESLDQQVVVMAGSWLRAAVEQAALTSGGNPRADIPQWLGSGATMLVAFGDVDWPFEMAKAERVAGVLSLVEVFSVGTSTLSNNQLLAANIQAAALVEFLAESHPDLFEGLIAQIARGRSAEVALLDGAGVTTQVLEAQWRAWYRNITSGVTSATVRVDRQSNL